MRLKIGTRVRQVQNGSNIHLKPIEGTIVDIMEEGRVTGYLVEHLLPGTEQMVKYIWPFWWELEVIND